MSVIFGKGLVEKRVTDRNKSMVSVREPPIVGVGGKRLGWESSIGLNFRFSHLRGQRKEIGVWASHSPKKLKPEVVAVQASECGGEVSYLSWSYRGLAASR